MELKKDSLEKLNSTINELEKSSKDIKGYQQIYADLAQLKNDISGNNVFFVNTTKKLGKVSDAIESLLKDFKISFRELDSSLITRLEKHRSDIQVDIRNEGTQIQRSFETTLKSSLESIKENFKIELEKQSKDIRTLKILTVFLMILIVGLLGSNFVKF
jgi:phosphoglycerate-specific signal transduction histidine kinase